MKEKGSKRAFLALLFILMIAFIAIIRPFLLPLLFATLIVVICNPVYQRILKFFKGKRYPSALVATILVLLCVIIPLGTAVAVIISNASTVAGHATSQLEGGQIAETIDRANTWLTATAHQYENYLPGDFNLRTALVELFKSLGKKAYQYSPRVVAATASATVGVLLLVIFVFMLFVEGGRIYNAMISLIPLEDSHKRILACEIQSVIAGTFLGMIGTSLAQGILIGIGFWIAGISNPFVWGLVAVGITLVPVMGGPLMYVPASVLLLLSGKTGSGIFLLAYGMAVVSTVDNVVKSLVMHGKVKTNPLLLALALIGGGMWLGPAGVIIGPLVVALMIACLKIYEREFE